MSSWSLNPRRSKRSLTRRPFALRALAACEPSWKKCLLNTMYELPSRADIGRVVVDREVVEDRVNPTLVPLHELEEPQERSA